MRARELQIYCKHNKDINAAAVASELRKKRKASNKRPNCHRAAQELAILKQTTTPYLVLVAMSTLKPTSQRLSDSIVVTLLHNCLNSTKLVERSRDGALANPVKICGSILPHMVSGGENVGVVLSFCRNVTKLSNELLGNAKRHTDKLFRVETTKVNDIAGVNVEAVRRRRPTRAVIVAAQTADVVHSRSSGRNITFTLATRLLLPTSSILKKRHASFGTRGTFGGGLRLNMSTHAPPFFLREPGSESGRARSFALVVLHLGGELQCSRPKKLNARLNPIGGSSRPHIYGVGRTLFQHVVNLSNSCHNERRCAIGNSSPRLAVAR